MIEVAVVGAGHWGPNLIGNFESGSRSRVRYVVDPDEGRLAAVRTRFPGIETRGEFASILDDPEVDAVVIATPTRTHFELARRALEKGKHVLVEKPLSHSVATSEELCELSERLDRLLMVGHVFIYNEAVREVKNLIEEGELGRLYYLSMVRTNLGPIRVDVDAAWDLAAHDISMANFWLDARPLSLTAMGGAFINEGIADVIFATLRYPNEILVNLHVSWLNPRKARDITLVGEKKMLTFDDVELDTPLKLYDKQVLEDRILPDFVDSFASFRTSVREGVVITPRLERTEPLRNECEHFLDCIETGKRPLSHDEEGLAVVRILEAISRSQSEGGREVEVSWP